MPIAGRIRLFVNTNRKVIVFFLLFAVIFLVLQRVYILTRAKSENILTHRLNAETASKIINLITPSERTVVVGSVIRSNRVGVDIKKGCEGFEVILLLVSAILAFPRGWKYKLVGIAVGMLLIYVVNLIRIISLFYTFKYARDYFEFMHLSLWQTIFIVMVAAYFMLWAGWRQGGKS